MPEEFENDEGLKAQREHIKELERALAEKDTALAAVAAEREAEVATKRSEGVHTHFEALGLPAEAVTLYPSDADVSPDAVAQWASTHGIVASRQPTRDESLMDSYNRLLGNSSTWTGPSHLDEATDRALKGVYASMPRKNPYQPSEAERAEAATVIEEVNAANRLAEREVMAGRADAPGLGGYGGRLDPPVYALPPETREALGR